MSQNQEYRYVSAARAKKRKRKPRVGRILLALVLVLALLGAVVTITWRLLSHKFNQIYVKQDQAGNLVETIVNTPEEYQGDVVNILVAGVSNDDNDLDELQFKGNVGLTDIIMYVTYDVKNNHVNVLQIPRDTYVGDISPNYKINAVYANGPHKGDYISNLAEVINQQLQLPVDYYATVDIAAFTEIIDLLGGIDMNVPYDVFDEVGNRVDKGLHHIDGSTARWILRQRKCYPQSDIGRMETQTHFYAACFRLFKTCSYTDLYKHVLPVVAYRVNTDMQFDTMLSLAVSMMKLEATDIYITRLPVGGMTINEQSVLVANPERTAELLNTYFRPYGDPVPAAALQLPTGYTPPAEYADSGTYLINLMTE